MSKLKVGDTVYHDYSGTKGEIKAILDRPNSSYKYFVLFDTRDDGDWYKEEVLRLAPVESGGKEE